MNPTLLVSPTFYLEKLQLAGNLPGDHSEHHLSSPWKGRNLEKIAKLLIFVTLQPLPNMTEWFECL